MVGISSNIASIGLNYQAPNVNPKAKDAEAARSAAQDFEAFFLTRMMETMFDGIKPNSMFGGGEAEKMYRSLLLDEYGKEMARLGGIGVQDQVMRTMLEMQEISEKGYVERA